MRKDEYFKKSDDLGLPRKCPILDKCSRRAWSIFMLGYYDVEKSSSINPFEFLINEGHLRPDFMDVKIGIQGGGPEMVSGGNNYYFEGMCPEVNLFDKSFGIFFARGLACVSGDWDNYRDEPKERVLECGHYSECSEFCKYQFDDKAFSQDDGFGAVEKIEQFVIADDIETALRKARAVSQELQLLELDRNCIVLLNRFNDLSNKNIRGTETPENMRIEKNKIVNSIMLIVEKIKGAS